MQFILLAWGAILWLCMHLWLPETSHPGTRGVDKAIEDDGSANFPAGEGNAVRTRAWRWVWLNPLGCLELLRSPNIFCVVCRNAVCYRDTLPASK